MEYLYRFESIPTEADIAFQVVHGTWADKTTEPKTVHLTLTDGWGTLPANEVPAGMIPDRGYKDGSRDMIPDTSVNAVTKNTTHTYTFIEAPEAGIPQNPDATIYEDGKPVLTRDKVSRAIKYEVYRSVNGGSYQLLTTMKGTSLRDGTAKSGQTCKYRVKAICSNRYGNSALSCIDTVKVK